MRDSHNFNVNLCYQRNLLESFDQLEPSELD